MKQMFSKEEVIKLIQENSTKLYLHTGYLEGSNGDEDEILLYYAIPSTKGEAFTFDEINNIRDGYAVDEVTKFAQWTLITINGDRYIPLKINEDTVVCVENASNSSTYEVEVVFETASDTVLPF